MFSLASPIETQFGFHQSQPGFIYNVFKCDCMYVGFSELIAQLFRSLSPGLRHAERPNHQNLIKIGIFRGLPVGFPNIYNSHLHQNPNHINNNLHIEI